MLLDHKKITRRDALRLGLQCTALGAFSTSPMLKAWADQQSQTSLKAAGSRAGCQIGTVVSKAWLQDPLFAKFVVENFNLLTVNGLQWGHVHPAPDTYDFTESEWNIDFAEKNGIRVHGHNLCWNTPGNPAWLKSVLNRSNARDYLTAHIATVMKRYQGRVDSWDVVNEPVVPWSHRGDLLYPGIWVDMLGPEYIDIAFQAAALADPKPLRILNIYRVEQDTPDDELTRTKTITLLKQLLGRGVPIQAVGIESHLDASQPLGKASFIDFLKDIRGLGLDVVITELDVVDRKPGNPPISGQTVAQYYGDYIVEVQAAVSPRFIVLWSVQDRWENGNHIQGLTWNQDRYVNGKRVPGHPWDHFKPGLNYHASLKALEQASPG